MSLRHARGRRWSTWCVGIRIATLALPGASRAQSADPGLAPNADLETPAPASAAPNPEASAPLRIWYRSSDGCPEGDAFIARLGELGRSAALAEVGDRVDFVVTLAGASDASSGRLERQTERGTVAIRQLTAPRCADVAAALALSLDLALEPRTTEASDAPSTTAPPVVTPSTTSATDQPARLYTTRASKSLGVGAQLSLATGLGPALAPGAALFVELGADGAAASARMSVHAAYREQSTRPAELGVGLYAAQLEGCLLIAQLSQFSLRPCLGFDLGLLDARLSGDAGQRDQGLWVAPLGLVRASFGLWPELAPEAHIAAVLPLVRYTVGSSEGGDLFQTEAVGVQFAFGIRWSP